MLKPLCTPWRRDLCDPAVIGHVQKFLQRALDLAVAVLHDDEYCVLVDQLSVILSDDESFYLSNCNPPVCSSASACTRGPCFVYLRGAMPADAFVQICGCSRLSQEKAEAMAVPGAAAVEWVDEVCAAWPCVSVQ